MSGYVLSIKFFRERKYEIIHASASKRYFRLAIPALFSVLFTYVLLLFDAYAMFTTHTGDLRYENMSNNFFIMLKITLFDVFFDYSNAYNGVLWTMTYELFGSFIIFSFLAIFGFNPKRYLIYLLLFIMFWDTYYLAFILGMLLSDWYNSPSNYRLGSKKSSVLTLVYFILGILFGSYPYPSNNLYSVLNISFLEVDYRIFYHIIGSFLLILAIIRSKLLQDFFSRKTFTYLGEISFSLYLMHFPVLSSLSFFTFDLLRNNYSYHISFLISSCLSILVTFAIAHLVSKYIDQNAVKCSNYIYSKFFKLKKDSVDTAA